MKNDSVVVWFDIPVLDLKRAVKFYSELLNLKIMVEKSDEGMEFGVIPCSGCLVESKDTKVSRDGVLIYLNVKGRLDEAVKVARNNNCEIVIDKTSIGKWGFRAIIIDTEGNQIALHS